MIAAVRSASQPCGGWRAKRSRLPRIMTARSAIRSHALAKIAATGSLPAMLDIRAPRALDLRYGENPHQAAALYSTRRGGIAAARQLQGKELSYNNLVDLDAAWQLIAEFDEPAAAILKHTNPCGCAETPALAESYRKAFEADPVSAYGGVLAFNRPLDGETASEIAKTFVEAIAAPDYSLDARDALASRKNLRLLEVGAEPPGALVVKSISGGYLAQTPDVHRLDRGQLQVKTRRAPTERRMARTRIRLESMQARQIECDRVRAAWAGRQRGRGADEPRGFRQGWRDEGRAAARRHGARLRCFFPVPGWR